jgi:hypothetical protein
MLLGRPLCFPLIRCRSRLIVDIKYPIGNRINKCGVMAFAAGVIYRSAFYSFKYNGSWL